MREEEHKVSFILNNAKKQTKLQSENIDLKFRLFFFSTERMKVFRILFGYTAMEWSRLLYI